MFVWPRLFSHVPPELTDHYEPDRPWRLLGFPLDALLRDSWRHIDGSAFIHDTAVIEGRVWIGRDCRIGPHSYLRDGCYIGNGARVGASCELKRAILLPDATVPHLSYVGDSILGARVNLGAGTILSNWRHDAGLISIRDLDGEIHDTGRTKLGAVLGDGVKTGCNAVISPGTIIGANTMIYPLVSLRGGAYPEEMIIKLRQQQDIVPMR